MTQTQMTAHLADKIGITKRQAKSALDELTELAQEGGLAPSGGTRGLSQAQAQGTHGPQPSDWRANQDSGPHPAAPYSG